MKYIYSLFLVIILFSCNYQSNKLIGLWYAIGINDDGSISKMDGKKDPMNIMSLEFNKDGNAFNNLAGNVTPYKWELSNGKVSLTTQFSAETIEIVENRLLISVYNNMPMIFIRENDAISKEELAGIIKRNKSQYLK